MKKRYVTNSPGLSPDLLCLHKKHDAINHNSDGNSLYTFPCARHALYYAVEALGLKQGSEILLPSFVCNTVIPPLKRRNLKLSFIDMTEDGKVKWSHAEGLISDKTAGILWHHYLGNSDGVEEAKSFALKHGLKFIEDCAHALFSYAGKKEVGSFGDAAIFSIRKTIPVTYAALLKINNDKIKRKINVNVVDLDSAYSLHLQKTEIYHIRNYYQSISPDKEIMRNSFMDHLKEAGRFHKEPDVVFPIDELSKTVIQNADGVKIRSVRTEIYSLYEKKLKKSALFNTLRKGSCPLAFPIVVKRGRDALQKRLEKEGIETARYWPKAMLPDGVVKEFRNARWLADHILTLPCHQTMSAADAEYVCRTVNRLL